MKIRARAAVTVMAATAAIVTAGCGSSGSPTPQSAGQTTTNGAATSPSVASPPVTSAATSQQNTGSGSAAAGSRCHTSMLSARVAMGSPGAGQRYASLILTNKASTACRVYGYPGMELITSSGAGLPTNVMRVSPSPTLVTVAPGAHVFSLLHWTVVPAPNETSNPCEPVPSAAHITPPDEMATLTTAWPGGGVCQHGQIFVTAFKPGTGP